MSNLLAEQRNDPYLGYWRESVSIALDEAGIAATREQIDEVAHSVQGSHENYGQAFYSPPASDRIADIEREFRKKLEAKDDEMLKREKRADDRAEDLIRTNNRLRWRIEELLEKAHG